VVQSGEVEGMFGVSKGFVFLNLYEDEPPRLYYQFELGSGRVSPHPTVLHETTLYLYVEASTGSVVPLTVFEEPFVDATSQSVAVTNMGKPTSETLETLGGCSEELVRLVTSTGFRRQKRQRQLRNIDRLVERAHSASGIRESEILLEAEYAYTTAPTAEGGIQYDVIGLRQLVVSGVCLGVSMLGAEQLGRKAIRRDSDLLNKYDGLSMAVELDEGVSLPEYLQLQAGDIVHVPISSQPIDILVEQRPGILQVLEAQDNGSAGDTA